MPRTASFLFLVIIAASARTAAQGLDKQQLIDQLKKTPVDRIEAGLPHESFESWFTKLIKPYQYPIEYEVKDNCLVENPRVAGSHLLPCVMAYTTLRPGWNPWIDICFAASAAIGTEKTGYGQSRKAFALKFYGASEGPSNPMMLRPAIYFSKLSELHKYMRGSRTQ